MRITDECTQKAVAMADSKKKKSEMINFALLVGDCICYGDKMWSGKGKVFRIHWFGS